MEQIKQTPVDGAVALSAEEWKFIETRRRAMQDEIAPQGIGTGLLWAKAKLSGKRFLDECTYIEREGRF